MPGKTRDEFLRSVRVAAARKRPPHTQETGPVEGEPGRTDQAGSLRDTFLARAEATGMDVHTVPDAEAARSLVVQLIRDAGLKNVLTWRTAAVAALGLADALAADEVRVEAWDAALPERERKAGAFEMTCGVTEADYAVAETGSLVVCSSPEHGRSVSLLGTHHIALVREDRILPDLYDLFPRLLADYPDGMPSNVTLITGPSKTADIELQLVVGVHGPGTVHVVLVRS